MILVQKISSPQRNAPSAASAPRTPTSKSSQDAPDWVRGLTVGSSIERRPLNRNHDEVQSVEESPASEKGVSRKEALLNVITSDKPEGRNDHRLRNTVKRPLKRSSSAPPAKRMPASINYNTHPLPQVGQDILTSKRIRDAKVIISWLTDLNVDTEPLKDLIRLVRSENKGSESREESGSSSHSSYGYVNPIPESFPKKDISSTLCELVGVLEWKFPCAPSSLSHAAPKTIAGTVSNPKYHAQRLQNIKRAFDVLSNKNNIPLSVLTGEDAVLEGRIDVILPLFMIIRKAYGMNHSMV